MRAGMTVSFISSNVLQAGGARGLFNGGTGSPLILGAIGQCLEQNIIIREVNIF